MFHYYTHFYVLSRYNTDECLYSGTPLNQPPLGPLKVSSLEGWPHFRGEFVLKSMLWDFSKWPEYRGGHNSGVLIRGVPLYFKFHITNLCRESANSPTDDIVITHLLIGAERIFIDSRHGAAIDKPVS